MDEKSQANGAQVDPIGEAMYREVLKQPVFKQGQPTALKGVREFTINHVFAKVWSRSSKHIEGQTISLRERRLITIALLAAQGRSDQLTEHVRGAARSGLKEAELLEVMIHVAHYAGWPAGASGQRAVLDVFREERRS